MIGRDAISISSAFSFKAWLSFLLLACSLLLQSPGGHAQNSLAAALQQQSEFLPVRDAYRLDGAVTGDGQLRLYWQIAEGYYLYQHMFKVMHAEASTPTNLSIDFPPALDKTDEFFGDVSVYYDEADLTVSLPDGEARLTLAVTYQGCADAGLCYPPETEHLLVDVATGAVTPTTLEVHRRVSLRALHWSEYDLVTGARAGLPRGLILNAMPCVFPILSLKVLSFATGDPGEHRRHGLAYLAGVVASFVMIASVLISLQSAGRWVGWGFQLQSTGFVIGLAYLFAVMGLSLSGLVLFGGRWMNLGAGLATAPGTAELFHGGTGGGGGEPLYRALYGQRAGLRPHPTGICGAGRLRRARRGHGDTDGCHQHERHRTTLAAQARRLDGNPETGDGLSVVPHSGLVALGSRQAKWRRHHGGGRGGPRDARARTDADPRRGDCPRRRSDLHGLSRYAGRCAR